MSAIFRAKLLIDGIRERPDRVERNLAEAERVLRGAAQIEPKSTEILTCLGAVLSDSGKHKEAAQILRSAISAGSQDRNTYFNLGVALINSASHEEAMSYFEKAKPLNRSSTTWEAYFDPQAH